jgi:hypothetical protein
MTTTVPVSRPSPPVAGLTENAILLRGENRGRDQYPKPSALVVLSLAGHWIAAEVLRSEHLASAVPGLLLERQEVRFTTGHDSAGATSPEMVVLDALANRSTVINCITDGRRYRVLNHTTCFAEGLPETHFWVDLQQIDEFFL